MKTGVLYPGQFTYWEKNHVLTVTSDIHMCTLAQITTHKHTPNTHTHVHAHTNTHTCTHVHTLKICKDIARKHTRHIHTLVKTTIISLLFFTFIH